MRLKAALVASGFVLALASIVRSQDAVDLGVVDRIKAEAFGRSEVMDHLHYLTDVHGPRLTGSTGFEDAAKWTTGRLAQFGLSNISHRTMAVRSPLVDRPVFAGAARAALHASCRRASGLE
jgi:hypothetical protein